MYILKLAFHNNNGKSFKILNTATCKTTISIVFE